MSINESELKDYGCSMVIYHTGNGWKTYDIPCYPEEITDSISVNWSDTTIVNRSSPLAAYVNTGYRSVSFTMTLHREMYEDRSHDQSYSTPQIDAILKAIRGAAYPRYTGSMVIPPIVSFSFGSEFKVKGIVRSVSYTWKKPIINGRYYICDVSIQMDQPLEGLASVRSVGEWNRPGNPFETLESASDIRAEATQAKKSKSYNSGKIYYGSTMVTGFGVSDNLNTRVSTETTSTGKIYTTGVKGH